MDGSTPRPDDSRRWYVKFLKFPLSYQKSGTVVEVNMTGTASDVFLVDNANLTVFERGGRFTYYGGHYRRSPALLQVPSVGVWTAVVVPPPGGTVRAAVKVLPKP
jgi:Domain of unknown function (DUF1883)